MAKRPTIKVSKPDFTVPTEIIEEAAVAPPLPGRTKTQAESDAYILIEAQEIRRDPQRFMAARAVNPNIQA